MAIFVPSFRKYSSMKFGVVTFPGSNCDKDMLYTAGVLMEQQVVSLWHKDHDLQGVDVVILPGGFSYGDYLRSGAIARFSPIMNEVIDFAKKGGLVFGICNGFQVLCEAGLLDGALLHNTSHRFICKNVHLLSSSRSSLINSATPADQPLTIPIAHGEGRYFVSDDDLKRLQDNDQVIYRYCDVQGRITPEANPNGSVWNIAGVRNAENNVFGMMPHPERAADPELSNTDGLYILNGLLNAVTAS